MTTPWHELYSAIDTCSTKPVEVRFIMLTPFEVDNWHQASLDHWHTPHHSQEHTLTQHRLSVMDRCDLSFDMPTDTAELCYLLADLEHLDGLVSKVMNVPRDRACVFHQPAASMHATMAMCPLDPQTHIIGFNLQEPRMRALLMGAMERNKFAIFCLVDVLVHEKAHSVSKYRGDSINTNTHNAAFYEIKRHVKATLLSQLAASPNADPFRPHTTCYGARIPYPLMFWKAMPDFVTENPLTIF
jgi:hypothetical protein